MSSLPRAMALGLLALTATGCELVFGLGDYARDGGAGGSGGDLAASTGGATSSGSRATSGGAGGDGSSATSTTSGPGAGGEDSGPTSSSSTGSGGGCPCVPDGWQLTEAYPVLDASPPRTCSTALLSDRAVEEPEVTCHCSCARADGLSCSLACWEQPGCSQGTPVLLPGAGLGCEQIGMTARSCAIAVVADGALATDLCEASETADIDGVNVFDLCDTSPAGSACGGPGVCGAPPQGALWCIRGGAGEACPEGWSDAHHVARGGEAACDCACSDALSCNSDIPFLLDNNCGFAAGPGSRACDDTGDVTTYRGNPPALGGSCDPVAAEMTGLLAGSTSETVCCQL